MSTKTYTKKVAKTTIDEMPEAQLPDVEETKEVKEQKSETKETAPREAKKIKTYSNEDLIPCICVRNNSVVYHSSKTDTRYEWNGYGDVCYVSYLDLVSLMSSKSQYLFEPLILIDDEDLLEDPRFSKLNEIYANFLMIDNPEDFFNLDINTFRRKLAAAPKSFQDLISTTAVKMIKEGTFESLPKLRAIDEILGTGLHEFI